VRTNQLSLRSTPTALVSQRDASSSRLIPGSPRPPPRDHAGAFMESLGCTVEAAADVRFGNLRPVVPAYSTPENTSCARAALRHGEQTVAKFA
jgi:hypothetical protein